MTPGEYPRAAAIVGAAGTIGSRLLADLCRHGVPVLRYTRHEPAVRDGVPRPALLRAPTVFYLASSITPGDVERAEADRAAFAELLDGLSRAGHRPTVVLTGSGGTVYDPRAEPPYAEDAPARPSGAYGAAKLRMEEELLSRADAVRPVVLRLANVYGPGGYGVIARWLGAVAEGRPLRLFGDPDVGRDYVYVEDVVRAMATVHTLAPDADLPAVLNIGSGTPVSLNRLLGVVGDVIGRRPAVERHPPRTYDRRTVWLDTGLARAALGWRAVTPLPTGVARTWHAMTARGHGHGPAPCDRHPSDRHGTYRGMGRHGQNSDQHDAGDRACLPGTPDRRGAHRPRP